jgi:hypothetical protein
MPTHDGEFLLRATPGRDGFGLGTSEATCGHESSIAHGRRSEMRNRSGGPRPARGLASPAPSRTIARGSPRKRGLRDAPGRVQRASPKDNDSRKRGAAVGSSRRMGATRARSVSTSTGSFWFGATRRVRRKPGARASGTATRARSIFSTFFSATANGVRRWFSWWPSAAGVTRRIYR